MRSVEGGFFELYLWERYFATPLLLFAAVIQILSELE